MKCCFPTILYCFHIRKLTSFFWQMIIAVIYCLNDSLNMFFTCLFTFIRFNHGRWLRSSAERKLTWMWRAIQVTRPYTSCRRRAGRTVWWNCCVGERIDQRQPFLMVNYSAVLSYLKCYVQRLIVFECKFKCNRYLSICLWYHITACSHIIFHIKKFNRIPNCRLDILQKSLRRPPVS